MAWQILKDETCPNCGIPIWLGHSTISALGFRVKRSTCESCKAKKIAANANVNKQDAGEVEYVEVVMAGNVPLPDRSQGYKTYGEVDLTRDEFDDDDDDEEVDEEEGPQG